MPPRACRDSAWTWSRHRSCSRGHAFRSRERGCSLCPCSIADHDARRQSPGVFR